MKRTIAFLKRVKGKIAVASILLVSAVFWNYASLAEAGNTWIRWGGYKPYNIHITFYDYDTDVPINSLTMSQGSTKTVKFDFNNQSPYIFGAMWAETIYIWSNGKKYQSVVDFADPLGGVEWVNSGSTSPKYSFTFSLPANAPLGDGSLEFTLYGWSWEFIHGSKQANMETYPVDLNISVQ